MEIGDLISYKEGEFIHYVIRYMVEDDSDPRKIGYCYTNKNSDSISTTRFSEEFETHETYNKNKSKFIINFGNITECESKKLILSAANIDREIKLNQLL